MTINPTQRAVRFHLQRAEAAMDKHDWAVVWRHLDTAFQIDPDHEETIALQVVAGRMVDEQAESSAAWGSVLSGVGGIFFFSILMVLGLVPLIFIVRAQIDEGFLWPGNRPFVWFGFLAALAVMGGTGLVGLAWSLISFVSGLRQRALMAVGRPENLDE